MESLSLGLEEIRRIRAGQGTAKEHQERIRQERPVLCGEHQTKNNPSTKKCVHRLGSDLQLRQGETDSGIVMNAEYIAPKNGVDSQELTYLVLSVLQ